MRLQAFQDNIGFSLYIVLSMYCLVVTSEDKMELNRERFLIEKSVLS